MIDLKDKPLFRLDRNAFKAHTAKEAAAHSQYYIQISWQERLHIAAYLNSVAYNYDLSNPPRMDKTAFKRKAFNLNG